MAGHPRRLAVLAATLVLAALVAFPGRGSAADSAVSPAGGGDPGLTLVSQTPFVTSSGTFSAQLKVSTPHPASDTIYTAVWSRLTSRSDFDQAVAGHPRGYQIWYRAPQTVAALGPSSAGVTVTVPVNQDQVDSFPARYGSAVYPLTFQLLTSGGTALGRPLTTFLIFSTGPSPGSPRLAVSLTVPVTGPPDAGPAPSRLPPAASSSLAELAATLERYAGVPVTLSVVPDVLDRLAAGTAADRATLAALESGAGDDQVLAAPYYPVSVAALSAAGLDSETQAQYAAGASTIQARLLQSPSPGAAAVTGGLDGTGLSGLTALGVTHLVLPDADLSPLPAADRQITFASPTGLAESRSANSSAAAADPGLSRLLTPGRLSPPDPPALAGEQLLAGLSLVQLEAPSVHRGVALLAADGSPVDPAVLRTLLDGLRSNPLLEPVTVDGLFRTVPAANLTRTLSDTRDAAPLAQSAAVRAARVAVAGLAAIAPDRQRVLVPAERQLLYATSSVVPPGSRADLLARVSAAVRKAEGGISLPGSSSITLTARTGTIPLTLLSNPALRARVLLKVVSPKLLFKPFASSLGTCTVPDSSTETCRLTLTSEASTLRIPVETRTSGVFSMQVSLLSPDGGVVLASNRDTVRSTAFSEVGVVLIVVATLGLAVWWVRNARHGRRARQLVDPPGEEPPPDPPPLDPVISEFFASPAPDYRDPSGPDLPGGAQVSPSGRRRGPNS